jgi:hypothetical protein
MDKIDNVLAILRRRSVAELRSHAERGNEWSSAEGINPPGSLFILVRVVTYLTGMPILTIAYIERK